MQKPLTFQSLKAQIADMELNCKNLEERDELNNANITANFDFSNDGRLTYYRLAALNKDPQGNINFTIYNHEVARPLGHE